MQYPTLPPAATFRFVGLGGVGSVLARYAAVLIASIAARQQASARIILIDGDNWEPKNSERALFHRPGPKASVLREDLLASAYLSSVLTIHAVDEYVTPANASRLLPGGTGEYILAAPDSHAVRRLLDAHVRSLADVVLICGGNDGVSDDPSVPESRRRGTAGTVSLHMRRGGVDLTPPISQYHPEIARSTQRLRTEMSCTELAADSGVQLLVANLQVATAMLAVLWNVLSGRAGVCHDLFFDVFRLEMSPVNYNAATND